MKPSLFIPALASHKYVTCSAGRLSGKTTCAYSLALDYFVALRTDVLYVSRSALPSQKTVLGTHSLNQVKQLDPLANWASYGLIVIDDADSYDLESFMIDLIDVPTKVVFISTPVNNQENSFFYELYARGLSNNHPDYYTVEWEYDANLLQA